MTYDVVIENGTVVDGTGAPRRRADIAVRDGVIVEIGKVDGRARRSIDAADLVVAPGFIDPHTHYDAQICWDDMPSPSCWHGVTTVMMGNCGVGLAPCRAAEREVSTWDLVNVEAIPFEVLEQGVTWDWESFPEYMDAAAARGPGLNLGFLAPLTPFRHYVLGAASAERAATPAETSTIADLLRAAVAAGAFGFSTTNVAQHVGYQGRALACRLAGNDELKAYANVLRDAGRGTIEIALTNDVSRVEASERALLDMLLTESGRPVTWLALLNRDDDPDAVARTLEEVQDLTERGAVPQGTCRPFIEQLDLRTPFMFANMPCWAAVLNRPVDEQMSILRDGAFRDAFRAEIERRLVFSGRWEAMTVLEAFTPALKVHQGRSIRAIAGERNSDPVDTFLDIALEDELRMQFNYEKFNSDPDRIPALINDPRIMIGLSDGGAHVDNLCDAGYCTYLLGTWVRDKAVMSLERAVQRITSEPASLFGITGRGRLASGLAADIAIFDPATVGSDKFGSMRHDLPGGGRRLVMEARGMEYTLVNGEVLFERGADTGARAGQVLRSGRA
ncbi:MAG: amidohydrolase family protein [Gammaproteobacteria bacterium]|nr:amidohydrolase family protein [Gammaproteobacteria bacterium]NNM00043.1 amidohydrolase family protein [Gammaproteobacteria bacterium]